MRCASLLAEELGHHGLRVDAASDRVAVLPVAGEDVVVPLQREHAADHCCLLADVQVAVAPDLCLCVLLLRALFEPADELHLPVEAKQEVAVVLLQLERLRCDRAGHRRWGGGRFDSGSHLLLLIIYLPARRRGGGGGVGPAIVLPARRGGGAEGAGGGVGPVLPARRGGGAEGAGGGL